MFMRFPDFQVVSSVLCLKITRLPPVTGICGDDTGLVPNSCQIIHELGTERLAVPLSIKDCQ